MHTLGTSLERVEKVINDLTGRHFVVQLNQIGVQILHILKNAAAVLAHRHDVADNSCGVMMDALTYGSRAPR